MFWREIIVEAAKMPYVPSKKTDGVSTDREVIDARVEDIAQVAAGRITNNLSLIKVYRDIFVAVAKELSSLIEGKKIGSSAKADLALAIYEVSQRYNYEGAYLGEFNYAFTRFIQRVPQIKAKAGAWAQELRYWIYASTVAALIYAASKTQDLSIGVDGVFMDIKDEYKRRVNTAYEAEQILKNGDCYDTPYYTRLVEVVDENGLVIGHQEIMMKRSESTLYKDLLDWQIVVKRK